MLENPFVLHLITQLLTLLAAVMLLFREPQNHSKNTWTAHVENKQKNSEVSEAKASWKLLYLYGLEKDTERLFSFSLSSKEACLSHSHLLCTQRWEGTKQRMKSAIHWVSFHWRVFEEQSKNHRIIGKECLEVSLVRSELTALTAVNW